MRKIPKHTGMWAYLNSTGVLEKGSNAEIKAAKREYRKQYFLKYKQSQRSKKPEFIISFSKENGDYGRILKAAKTHKMAFSGFVREAVLSYVNQTFLVPNSDQLLRLEQILSQCLNEIQSIVKPKERFSFERERKFEEIEKQIEKIRVNINQIFRNPPLCKHDHQNQIP